MFGLASSCQAGLEAASQVSSNGTTWCFLGGSLEDVYSLPLWGGVEVMMVGSAGDSESSRPLLMPSSLLNVWLIRGFVAGFSPVMARAQLPVKQWNFRLPLLRSCLLPAP